MKIVQRHAQLARLMFTTVRVSLSRAIPTSRAMQNWTRTPIQNMEQTRNLRQRIKNLDLIHRKQRTLKIRNWTSSSKHPPLRLRHHASKDPWDKTRMAQPCMRTSHDSPRLTRLRDLLKKNLFKRIHTRIRLRICLIKSQAGLRSLLKLMTPVFTRRSSRHPKVNLTPVPMPLNQAPSESTQLTSWMSSQRPNASLRHRPATKTLTRQTTCRQCKLTILTWIRWVRESTLAARRLRLEVKKKV